jgi:hypothetical protein
LLSVDRKKSIIESPWGRVYMGIRGRWRLEQGTETEYIQLLHLQYSVCADFVSWPVGLSVANMGIQEDRKTGVECRRLQGLYDRRARDKAEHIIEDPTQSCPMF